MKSKNVSYNGVKHRKGVVMENTSDPLHLSRKVTTMCENAHGALSRQAHAPATQILRACAVEVHMDDVERHECTVNSNELAVHARAPQRSKHTFLSPTVRTPQCAHTVWGTHKKYIYCIYRIIFNNEL